jgi:hypothetical protein
MKKLLVLIVFCVAQQLTAQSCTRVCEDKKSNKSVCEASKCAKQNVVYNITEEERDGKEIKEQNIVITDADKVKVINIISTKGEATEVNIVDNGSAKSFRIEGSEKEIIAELKRLGIDLASILEQYH